MTTVEIFDPRQIAAAKRRAAPAIRDFDFLHRHVAGELTSRLTAISRDFRVIADIGAGHGVLTQSLRAAFPQADVLPVEASRPLLRLFQGHRVQAREDALPLRQGAFDLIASGLSLHLVNDLPGALIQVRRALKPDGLFLAALLGGESLGELREALMLAETEITGGMSPRVFPTADVRDMGGLLQRAGFALPVADAERLTVTYASPLALMRDLRGMGATNALAMRSRKPMRRTVLTRTSEIYAQKFPAGDGRVRATFEILYLSGWSPHESQQKPLKPGSAAARLADALGTVEHAAGDKAPFPLSKKPQT